jgi:hypothetical protein
MQILVTRCLAIALTSALVSACAAPVPASDSGTQTEITAAALAWQSAYNSRSLKRLSAAYAETAVF